MRHGPQLKTIDARYAAKLYLVGKPQLEWAEVGRFLQDTGLEWKRDEGPTNSEHLVEFAGRICYRSFSELQSPRSTEAYIQNLIQREHDSVLEHASWSFLLTGVSRALTHQLVRHRAGFSFSQLSQQYFVDDQPTFIMPSVLQHDIDARLQWEASIRASIQIYYQLLASSDIATAGPDLEERERRRLIRSAARSILPAALETKIAFTVNARAIRHFLTLRGGLDGDEEMRSVSVLILEIVSKEAPSLFGDFGTYILGDGSRGVRRM